MMSLIKIGLREQNLNQGDKTYIFAKDSRFKSKIVFVIYILKFQTRQACDTQIYKCIFPHVFHLFITIICYPLLCHVSYSTFFSALFRLKQVQYATTPSNLYSLEGEAGEGIWVGVLKEGV